MLTRRLKGAQSLMIDNTVAAEPTEKPLGPSGSKHPMVEPMTTAFAMEGAL